MTFISAVAMPAATHEMCMLCAVTTGTMISSVGADQMIWPVRFATHCSCSSATSGSIWSHSRSTYLSPQQCQPWVSDLAPVALQRASTTHIKSIGSTSATMPTAANTSQYLRTRGLLERPGARHTNPTKAAK